ncbi:MAG: hypothetical protein EOP87_20860 [Verrucomicrobiaceae bacterium]|nr:MAG: hypothetical protein EOP87_20860 [Verrucomicrobiaceae bacterium]
MNNDSITRGYEVRDASPRWLYAVGAALLIVICLSLVFLRVAYGERVGPRSSSQGQGFRGAATAKTEIEEDWRKLDAEMADRLTKYRWINRQKGTVQIPLERAMEILAEREKEP